MRLWLAALCFGISACVSTPPSATAQTPSETLFSFEPYYLHVSRYWQVGALQDRLNAALTACNLPAGLTVDYEPGRVTAGAIRRLRTCDAFKIEGEENSGALTAALWTRLWPDAPLPTLAERTRVFTFSFETTDYNEFLWNVGQPGDPYAWGTWAPFGATIGAGGEIQTIARAIEARAPGTIAAAFAQASSEPDALDPPHGWRTEHCANTAHTQPNTSGATLLLSLTAPWGNATAAERQALINEFCADDQYRKWFGAFRALGDNPVVREAFDTHYATQNRRIVRRLAALYERRGWTPTEIDWAFFLDRGTQFTTSESAANAALDALAPTATPAQRRLAISRSSLPTQASQRNLRIARDMAFILDDPAAAAELNTEERRLWDYYAKRLASQVGLSDERSVPASPF